MPKLQSPSFARNHSAIWSAISDVVTNLQPPAVLELACGSGEHAMTYARHAPDVTWQPTDGSLEAIASANAWRDEVDLENLREALQFDLAGATPDSIAGQEFGAVFTANFIHMVPLSIVELIFRKTAALVSAGAPLLVYDTFTYGGEHVSESNVRFDAWLKERGGAVHAFETVDAMAAAAGWTFTSRVDLPANNQLTTWTRAP